MDLPSWVPWVLALSLAWPVALGLRPGATRSRAGLVVALAPALVVAVVAAGLTVDRLRVDQDELDGAVGAAARALDGSTGPVSAQQVAALVSADLGRDVGTEQSELTVASELQASYTIEVRADSDESGLAACVAVDLQTVDARARDLRFADVESRSGTCG